MSCSFAYCKHNLHDKVNLTQRDKKHFQRYHEGTTRKVGLRGVVLFFRRDSSRNMSFVCPCGTTLSNGDAVHAHVKGSEKRQECSSIAEVEQYVARSNTPLHDASCSNLTFNAWPKDYRGIIFKRSEEFGHSGVFQHSGVLKHTVDDAPRQELDNDQVSNDTMDDEPGVEMETDEVFNEIVDYGPGQEIESRLPTSEHLQRLEIALESTLQTLQAAVRTISETQSEVLALRIQVNALVLAHQGYNSTL